MKAIFPALPCVDSQPNELDGALSKGDAKEAGAGFDAVLALASARTAAQSGAVKPLAPANVLQPAPADLDCAALIALDLEAAPAVQPQPPTTDAAQRPQPSTVEVEECRQPRAIQDVPPAVPQAPAFWASAPRLDGQLPQAEVLDAQVAVQDERQAPQTATRSTPEVQRPGFGGSAIVPTPPSSPTGAVAASTTEALAFADQGMEQASEREASAGVSTEGVTPVRDAASPFDLPQDLPAKTALGAQDAELSADELAAQHAPIQPKEFGTSRPPQTRAAAKTSGQDPASISPATTPVPNVGAGRAPATPVAQTAANVPEQPAAEPAERAAKIASGPRKGDRSRSLLSGEAEPAAISVPLHPPTLERHPELALQAAVQNGPARVAPPAATSRQPAPSPLTTPATTAAPQPQKLAAVFEDEPSFDQPQSPDVDASPFADLLRESPPSGSQGSAGATPIETAEVAPAETTASTREVRPLHVESDPDTGARVVHIEYFSAAAPAAPHAQDGVGSEPSAPRAQLETKPLEANPASDPQGDVLAAEAPVVTDSVATAEQDRATASEGRTASDERPATHADGDERGSTDPREGASSGHEGSGQDRGQPRAQVFQTTEVQGMRGLDAVVASLLRAGHSDDAARVATGPERATFVAPTGPANTAKSQTSKSAEKAATLVDGQRKDALEREEERVLEHDRARLEPLPLHVQLEPRPQDPRGMELKAPEVSLPNPSSSLPDPDSAAMGKLARGEGVNGASIAIEHPELGPMKVLVQNENGRIDVRAVLETPRAAAVLRAHESALRYGIQQAGMTFGALRVRTRGGEPEPIKTQGTTKRRRGQEWEA